LVSINELFYDARPTKSQGHGLEGPKIERRSEEIFSFPRHVQPRPVAASIDTWVQNPG